MDHERVKASFTCYHDGNLSEEDRRILEEHLAVCDDCRKEWETYCRTVGEISGLRDIVPPHDFARHVVQEIRRRKVGESFVEKSLLGIKIAVLSFVLMMIFLLVYLTYLLLFAGPGTNNRPQGGATERDAGSYRVIGPIQIAPPAKMDKKE